MKNIVLLLLFCTFLSSCNILEQPVILPETTEEVIEYTLIQDLRGREVRVASSWPYLPFEQINRLNHEYNITLIEILISHNDIIPALHTSVMARDPFADMVLLSDSMIFHAITNDLIYALEEFLPLTSDNDSILLPSAKFADLHWAFAPYAVNLDGAFLGVNMNIIRAIGAEDPYLLYRRGEWTFEKFYQIMTFASENGYFGISGVPEDIIVHLIAAGGGAMVHNYKYAYDFPGTISALELAYDIFSKGLWQNNFGLRDWESNFYAFLENRAAFFPLTEWSLHQMEPTFDYVLLPFPKGPENLENYTFMRGFDTGMTFPRNTVRPADVATVFEAIFEWSQDNVTLYGPHGIEGKFDYGMVVFTFNWVNGILASGFYDGTLSVAQAVEQFREPQQAILDEALKNWILN